MYRHEHKLFLVIELLTIHLPVLCHARFPKSSPPQGGSGDAAGSPTDLQKLLDEKMKVYNNLAATQMKLLAYDSAIKSCDAVIKLQPNNVKALFRKGQALESKKDNAEALVYFKVRLLVTWK